MKRLIFLLLLLPSLAFSQVNKKLVHFMLAGGGSSTPSTNITDATFDFNEIQRTNANWDLGVTVSGAIALTQTFAVRDKSGTLVAYSSSDVIGTYITEPGYYDIEFSALTATDQYVKRLDDVFNWYPQFTEGEADLVINLTSSGTQYHDFASADLSGYKIFVKGTGTGYLAFLNTLGSSGWANHVRVQKSNDNTTTQINAQAGSHGLNFITNSRYIVVDGVNADGTNGFTVNGLASSLQPVMIQDVFTDIHIVGLNVTKTGYSDVASIAMIPLANVTYNASTFAADNMSVVRCSITDAGAEGVYAGYNNDTPQSTYTPTKLRNLLIAHNSIVDSGNDGIQPGGAVNLRIHNNYIDNWGTQASAGHESAISYNAGCYGKVYNNYATGGKMFINMNAGYKPWDVLDGQTTPQKTTFIGNVFDNDGASTATEASAIYIQNGPGSNTADWPLEFVHNTFITNRQLAYYTFNTGAFTSPTFKMFNNIVVKEDNGEDYDELTFAGSGTQPSSPVVNNLVRQAGAESDLLFINAAAGNYKISNLSSPAFTGATNTASNISGTNLNDYEGLPLLGAGAYSFGAYGGYGYKVITPDGDPDAAAFDTALSVENLTDNSGDIEFEADKEGKLYWSIVANDATAPTKAQLIVGGFGITSGEILGALSPSVGSFTGLSEGTAYDLHGLFVTIDGVEQASITKVDFTTTSDVVAPTLSAWEIRNAAPNRLYFSSSEVITASTYGNFTIDQIVGTTVTVTGVTINTGATTDHYFTLSENVESIDFLARVAYSGSGSNLQDAAGNALASFAATSITNSITYSQLINVNIMNSSPSGSTAWNDAELSGTAGVKTLVADLDNEFNTPTGYSLAISEAFNGVATGLTSSTGTYLSITAVGATGIEVYNNSGGSSSGTLRIAGLTPGATGHIIYGIKGNFGSGAGNVNINGAGGVAFSTAYGEFKQSFTANGSGHVDIVMTETVFNASNTMTGFRAIID